MNEETKIAACKFLFGLGIANFVVFWILAVYLGGDAVNGKMQDGHFFLMSHGRYTEVSEAIFRYSKWHVYSTWITHPMVFFCGYFLHRHRKPLS
ncbi:MAG: hypothetical protein JWN23_2488 [Rhodocyclales bacterium]|nr:hypothetical protein [Rhodocyclales bacterium]